MWCTFSNAVFQWLLGALLPHLPRHTRGLLGPEFEGLHLQRHTRGLLGPKYRDLHLQRHTRGIARFQRFVVVRKRAALRGRIALCTREA